MDCCWSWRYLKTWTKSLVKICGNYFMKIVFPTESRCIQIHVVQMECCNCMCHDSSNFLRFHEIPRMSGKFLISKIGHQQPELYESNESTPMALALGVFIIRCTWLKSLCHSVIWTSDQVQHPNCFKGWQCWKVSIWFGINTTQVSFPLLWIQ